MVFGHGCTRSAPFSSTMRQAFTNQPRFELYMRYKQLRPGDPYKPYEYIGWIGEHSEAFKKSIGKHYLDVLTQLEQDDFTEYLRNTVDVE